MSGVVAGFLGGVVGGVVVIVVVFVCFVAVPWIIQQIVNKG